LLYSSKKWRAAKLATNKSFCLYIMLIICLFVPLALPTVCYSTEIPTTVVEVFHDRTHVIALEPEVTNTDVSLVPLRSMLEPHGIIIKYNSPNDSIRDTTTFTLYIGSNSIGSTRVALNRGSRTTGRILFLECPPRIVNGQTMVPSNFIQEILDAVENREQYLKKIAASDYLSKNPIENQKGYTYYCPAIGPESGPTFDQAIIYVTEHKLVQSVTGAENSPHRFEEFGPRSTMVVGKDELGREKAIWITQNKYTKELSVIASVYLDQIITRDVIYDKMQTMGIAEKDIKKIHLAPDTPGKILWYVAAEKNNISYYTAFDCLSGEVCLKWSV